MGTTGRRPGPPSGRRISTPVLAAAAATAGIAVIGLCVAVLSAGSPHANARTADGAAFAQTSAASGSTAGNGLVGLTGATPGGLVPGTGIGITGSPGALVPTGGATGQPGSGATQGSGSNGSGTVQNPGGSPSAAAPATYADIAGPGCPASGAGVTNHGWFDDGESGWTAHDSGGYTGNGCSGAFNDMPMSGNANTDDSSNSVVWYFDTGAVGTGTCQVYVYVPDDSNIEDVGGNPSYYTVQNQTAPGAGTVGSFSVDQVGHLGAWVGGGSFPDTGGLFAVMLHSRGIDWTDSGPTYAHHAVSAVKVACTA